MDRSEVAQWVSGYERAWRSSGTESLAKLFTRDAQYLVSPWAPPLDGVAAIAEMWDRERESPDEAFEMSSEVVAVDGQIAVVRVVVEYQRASPSRWRDLWVLEFEDEGGVSRCSRFEEWPFAPGQPDGHQPQSS
jgi:ketosteroid isomerase-like protein